MRLLSLLTIALLAAASARGAAAEPRKPPALVILERAIAKESQPGALDKALRDLDALIARNGRDPDAHYARGWVLSHLGRDDAAVTAYDRAFELDRSLADAPYNAGVVLARLGRRADAIVRFERALAANPRHVDAAYNAGQAYYDGKDFAKAAERWKHAAAVMPGDFQIAKKLVQVHVALGDDAGVAAARDKVFELWRAAKDPALLKLKSYVYDQFEVGKYRIHVYEAFDSSGDVAYVYQFAVTEGDRALGSVSLETSVVTRDRGHPFVLGLDKGGKHAVIGPMWPQRPDYRAAKTAAIAAIKASF